MIFWSIYIPQLYEYNWSREYQDNWLGNNRNLQEGDNIESF